MRAVAVHIRRGGEDARRSARSAAPVARLRRPDRRRRRPARGVRAAQQRGRAGDQLVPAAELARREAARRGGRGCAARTHSGDGVYFNWWLKEQQPHLTGNRQPLYSVPAAGAFARNALRARRARTPRLPRAVPETRRGSSGGGSPAGRRRALIRARRSEALLHTWMQTPRQCTHSSSVTQTRPRYLSLVSFHIMSQSEQFYIQYCIEKIPVHFQ